MNVTIDHKVQSSNQSGRYSAKAIYFYLTGLLQKVGIAILSDNVQRAWQRLRPRTSIELHFSKYLFSITIKFRIIKNISDTINSRGPITYGHHLIIT